MDANQIWIEIRNTFRRVVRSNFQVEHASTAERVKLASSSVPLNDPLVQNYAVWRKALLWIAAITLSILSIIQAISFESIASTAKELNIHPDQLGQENIQLIDGIQILILISHFVGTILIILAACMWANVPRSKNLARIGWIIMFLTPFAMAILPLSSFLDLGRLGEAGALVRALLGMILGLWFFMHIGPKGLSLFAGVIRSAMTLKTLLPESSAPGWAAIMFAPLYSLFMVVITSFVIQSGGNIWLVFGLVCFVIAPLVYVVRSGAISKPQTGEEVGPVVRGVRLTVSILNLVGVVFLIIFAFSSHVVSFWDVIKFTLGFIATTMALTVVASDFILAMIWKGYEQSKRFQGSPHQQTLEAKFQALSSVGLTRFIGAAAVAMPAIAPPIPPAGAIAGNVEVTLDSDDGNAPSPDNTGDNAGTPPPPSA